MVPDKESDHLFCIESDVSEIYFLLDSDEKILKLFPDAEIKRVYFSNHNNSVVILLPQETIKKNN
jgi:hypothetical protein